MSEESTSLGSSSAESESDIEIIEAHDAPLNPGGNSSDPKPDKKRTKKHKPTVEDKNATEMITFDSSGGSDKAFTDKTFSDAAEFVDDLGADEEFGLSSAEAAERLKKFGKNDISSKKKNIFFRIFHFFWNPLAWAMEFAAIVAFVLGDYPDTIFIAALLLLNAAIGFYEERNAGKAIDALKRKLVSSAKVLRDGEYVDIAAPLIVPGDVIHVAIGDILPADVRILHCEGIASVDQSALTGESIAAKKKIGDVIYSGSTLEKGSLTCVVFATGEQTYFGKAASLVRAASGAKPHYQLILKITSYICLAFIIVSVIVLVIVQFGIRQNSCDGLEWQDKDCPDLNNLLVMIVGGVPIAMPTVLSVTMAMGAHALAKKKAIITRLSAIEELAAMNILCCDKTGTLTKNELTINPDCILLGVSKNRMLGLASLSCQTVSPDAIDQALIRAGKKKAIKKVTKKYTVESLHPFDPVSKMSSAVIVRKSDGKKFVCAKGAPQVMLRNCSNKKKVSAVVKQGMSDQAKRGFRTLGVSLGSPTAKKLKMLGLLPIFDPPRDDSKATISYLKQNSIDVKMITGDQLAIGKETGRRLHLGDKMYSAKTMLQTKPSELDELIFTADGFAQVFPEHKHMIVENLQNQGYFVGMTGDGVNDAPALKKADIGIAVSGATDAAKSAADIVLLADGLSVIKDALIGSRQIFQRMQNYTIYSVAASLRIVITFTVLTLAYDFHFPTILTALLAILNDGTMLTISRDRVLPMDKPAKWHLWKIMLFAISMSIYLSASTVFLLFLLKSTNVFTDWWTMRELEKAELVGVIYLQTAISEQSTVFITRTHDWFFKHRPTLWLILAFFIAQTIATVIAIFGFDGYPNDGESNFEGCGWDYAIAVWIYCMFSFLLMDVVKKIMWSFLNAIEHRLPNHFKFKSGKKKIQEHPIFKKFGETGGFGLWPQLRTAGGTQELPEEVDWGTLEHKVYADSLHELKEYAKRREKEVGRAAMHKKRTNK